MSLNKNKIAPNEGGYYVKEGGYYVKEEGYPYYVKDLTMLKIYLSW
jgi:hypothetical protein